MESSAYEVIIVFGGLMLRLGRERKAGRGAGEGGTCETSQLIEDYFFLIWQRGQICHFPLWCHLSAPFLPDDTNSAFNAIL